MSVFVSWYTANPPRPHSACKLFHLQNPYKLRINQLLGVGSCTVFGGMCALWPFCLCSCVPGGQMPVCPSEEFGISLSNRSMEDMGPLILPSHISDVTSHHPLRYFSYQDWKGQIVPLTWPSPSISSCQLVTVTLMWLVTASQVFHISGWNQMSVVVSWYTDTPVRPHLACKLFWMLCRPIKKKPFFLLIRMKLIHCWEYRAVLVI